MTEIFRIKLKVAENEVEVESSDKSFVESKIEEYVLSLGLIRAGHESNGTDMQQFNLEQVQSATKSLSLNEFLNKVTPASGPEYVVAIGYFLEKHVGQPSFSSADIRSYFQKAKYQHSNPSDAMAKAKAAGNVMDGSEKNTYVLTRTGEIWTEERISATGT